MRRAHFNAPRGAGGKGGAAHLSAPYALVMFDGRVMGELPGDAGEREIGLLMSGVSQEDAA